MSLATERERRKGAGSKMAKLLDEEEEDEFYKTAYGGFDEVNFKLYNLITKKYIYIKLND